MQRLREDMRVLGLFVAAGLAPFLGLVLLPVAGCTLIRYASLSWLGLAVAAGGGGCLLLGGAGLRLALKSWPRPRGREIQPEEAPLLTGWLTSLSEAWAGPRAVSVLVEPLGWGQDLVGTPTFGMLGWMRFQWVIGIFPLLALSARELETLVSWELVWWSEQQGWLNLQVKRLSGYWQRVLAEEGPGTGKGVGARVDRWLERPLRWVAQGLVRRLEGFLLRECLWADAAVADQHGASTLGRALCRMAILKARVDRRIYPQLQARLLAGAPMPEDLYAHLAQALGRCPEFAEGTLALALDGLLPEAPPLLKLRLDRLDVPAAVALPPGAPAILNLLEGTPLLGELEGQLKLSIWTQVRNLALRKETGDRRFQALDRAVAGFFPRHPKASEYLTLAFDRIPLDPFLVLLKAFQTCYPHHLDGKLLALQAAFRQGREEEGQALAQDLRFQNPFLAPFCHHLVGEHYRDQGGWDRAEQEWNEAVRAEQALAPARMERMGVSWSDPLEPHGCSSTQVQALVRCLEDMEAVRSAFLVRKRVDFHPGHPVLLLVVELKTQGTSGGRERLQEELTRQCPFPPAATGYVRVAGPGELWGRRMVLRQLEALILSRGPASEPVPMRPRRGVRKPTPSRIAV